MSRTTSFELFNDAGWYPRRTSGESMWRRIEGLILLTCFQVEWGIPSGPGADVGEHFESAVAISSVVRGGADLFGLSLGGGEKGSLGGKKCSRSTLFICCGFSAPGREGKRGWARP